MPKTILITGATDGIGLETAKMLAQDGHTLILHGRNSEKLKRVMEDVKAINSDVVVNDFVSDFSIMKDVHEMVEAVLKQYKHLDVLINNAGVFVLNNAKTVDGLDTRFAVNTIAPYILTKGLLPIMDEKTRVVNLSSAAQSRVSLEALMHGGPLSDGEAYGQSKLAITMWSFQMARDLENGPSIIAVNPKSFLGSKMVKEAYGRQGHNLRLGADILCRAALSDEFEDASGKYFDNDMERFANPNPDALDEQMRINLVDAIENVIENLN